MSSIGPFFDSFNVQRAELADTDVLRSLNTYRNWGPFTAPIQRIEVDEKPENDKSLDNKSVKSLFNPVYSVGYNHFIQVRQNAPLLDMPENRRQARDKKDCSIKALVEASQTNRLGRAVYSYADFMYCKHLGKISNNYLVTLRRFPFPAGDHINYLDPWDDEHTGLSSGTEQHNPDIGRLVTWMGTPGNDMSKILTWNVKMPFKEMRSGIEDAGDAGGDNGGPLGTFLNATTNSTYRKQMVSGYAGTSTFGYMGKLVKPMSGFFSAGGNPPYSGNMGFMDHNKIYGPLDVIASTHVRDVGLEFNQDIELVFDYELRSYDGINPKMAFLDLLGNILAVTYANGAFWGGAYRGTGASQSNVFANLPIYKLNGTESFSDVVSTFVDSGKQIISSLGGNTGDPLKSIENVINTIAKGAFSALLGAGLNALGRPQKHGVASLLSPMPVGFWHLTVGNPWNPIMSIGNLILDGATVEQYGPLGLDDFPTGIKVTVKLKHGKPRDATQIEHMFMQGDDRIYTPVDSEVLEMYKAADPVVAQRNMSLKTISNSFENREKSLLGLLNGSKNYNPFIVGKDISRMINSKNNMSYAASVLQSQSEKSTLPGQESPSPESTSSAKTDTQKKAELDYMARHFFQWFGTNDETVISTVAREAAFGSKRSGRDDTGKMK